MHGGAVSDVKAPAKATPAKKNFIGGIQAYDSLSRAPGAKFCEFWARGGSHRPNPPISEAFTG
jgi:hypothetical protein